MQSHNLSHLRGIKTVGFEIHAVMHLCVKLTLQITEYGSV